MEKKSTQDWMQDWQALQKQYWSAWSDATRQTVGQMPPPSTPWHEGLEQWARLFGDSGKQSETADRLLASAKSYVALMQSMLAAASGKGDAAAPVAAWSEALRQGFNLPGVDASALDNPLAAMLRGIGGDGAKGFEQLAESFAPFLAQAREEGMSWLHAPAFGYAREHQEHYQRMLAAFVEYQEALKRYNELILKSSRRSFEIFEGKLAERGEPGRQIDSMRALYDLWVDAAEEAYAEIALTDDFRKVYGDVVNAQTRVRAQIQAEVERVGTDLGMPTRTELNSVHKRLHDLRREFRAAHASETAAEIAALRAEVEELKRALAAKQAKPERAEVAKPERAEAAKPAAKAPAKSPRRAAAVASPKAASRRGALSFDDAIQAMRRATPRKQGGKA